MKSAALLFIFLLSHLGYGLWVKKWMRMPWTLVSLFVISLESLVLYLGALLGGLPFFIYGVFGLGLIALVAGLVLSPRQEFKGKLDWRLVTLGVMFLFGVWYLSKNGFYHNDDFSHWGTMVKFLYQEGRLPQAGDKLISFYIYPPTTALFVDYFVTMVGFSEGHMLVGQFLIILSSLSAIFSLKDRPKTVLPYLSQVAMVGFFLLTLHDSLLTTLMVDSLLALIALASLAYIRYYSQNKVYQAISVSVILNFLCLVKRSALILVIFSLVYYAYSLRYSDVGKSLKRKCLAFVGVFSFLGYFLWEAHIKVNFSQLGHAKHAVSAANKTGDFYRGILQKFVAQVLNWHTLSFRSLALLIVMIGGVWIISRYWFKEGMHLKKVVFSLLTILGMYWIGLLATYWFAMPIEDAVRIATYGRYMETILIYMSGIYFMTLNDYLSQVDKEEMTGFKFGIIGLMLGVFLLGSFHKAYTEYHSAAEGLYSQPRQIRGLLADKSLKAHQRYLVVTGDISSDRFYYYVCAHYFWTPEVHISSHDFHAEDLQKVDKVLVLQPRNESFQTYCKTHLSKEVSPGLYEAGTLLGDKK